MSEKIAEKIEKVHEKRKPRFKALFQYVFISLLLIAAVEYFKYSTRIHYEWFHCTAVKQPFNQNDGSISSVNKIFAVGGPSCDKRGELKIIMKRITRDYEPNDENYSFCIVENENVASIHYPLGEDKGKPGYHAFVGYDHDKELVEDLCKDSTIYHL
ncbi:ceramide synthase subunit Lip1p [Monosporozyma unispora]|nr:sphingosine N-acyltransferase subunit lip1 [Kazachstania unispora]